MKKLLSAAMLFTSFAFAEEENWYLKTAKELTLTLGELSADEGFLAMMTSQSYECIETFSQNDFANIASAWRFDLPPEAGMRAIMGFAAGTETPLSELAWEYIYSRLPQMIATQHNGTLGVEQVAAAAMLNYSRTYVMPNDFAPCGIALELENAIAYVSFSQTGNDTITATVQPVFCPEGNSPTEVIPTLGIYLAPSRTQLF